MANSSKRWEITYFRSGKAICEAYVVATDKIEAVILASMELEKRKIRWDVYSVGIHSSLHPGDLVIPEVYIHEMD